MKLPDVEWKDLEPGEYVEWPINPDKYKIVKRIQPKAMSEEERREKFIDAFEAAASMDCFITAAGLLWDTFAKEKKDD